MPSRRRLNAHPRCAKATFPPRRVATSSMLDISCCRWSPPMPRKNILSLLEGGDRRTIGQTDRVATAVTKDPKLFPQLIAGLWFENLLIRMRAADAAEKVTRKYPVLLQPFKKELLGLMAETRQQEMRWHLAVMVPRLTLTADERQLAASSLNVYLEDRSSIVKTFALQGLAAL